MFDKEDQFIGKIWNKTQVISITNGITLEVNNMIWGDISSVVWYNTIRHVQPIMICSKYNSN